MTRLPHIFTSNPYVTKSITYKSKRFRNILALFSTYAWSDNIIDIFILLLELMEMIKIIHGPILGLSTSPLVYDSTLAK